MRTWRRWLVKSYSPFSQRVGDGLSSHLRAKNLENLVHGKKKKESLPQGIIKPLGDDDDDGTFSLDEAIDMVCHFDLNFE